jgi:hypothetical protein
MYKVGNMCILVYMWNAPKVHDSAWQTQWKHMKRQANQCITLIKYYTYEFFSTCNTYENYMFLQLKCSKKPKKTPTQPGILCTKHGPCVFFYHVKSIKSKYVCSRNTAKTQENTYKTMHFMYEAWYMCILVYMWKFP